VVYSYIEIKKIISSEIAVSIYKKYGFEEGVVSIFHSLSTPPKIENGDIAFPCFNIAKKIGEKPVDIARALCDEFNPESIKEKKEAMEALFESSDFKIDVEDFASLIDKISIEGPYLNFHINKSKVAAYLLSSRLAIPFHDRFMEGYRIVIDYSSCNIAKPYGIGHIMSTAIGESLKRCYEFAGAFVAGINYLGDWGTQFGLVLLAFEFWGDEKKLDEGGVYYLYELYVRINEEQKNDASIREKAKEIFQKLEDDDPYYKKMWEMIREISIKDFQKYYTLFGNTFTHIEGESQYSKSSIENVVHMLELNGILQESDGAEVVFLDDIYPNEKIPPCMIKKSDGTTTYAVRDIAAALDRWQRFHFDESLYVINISQRLHIQQIKGVIKKLNLPFADSMVHVAFGTMTFSGEKMQTRKGTIKFLREIYEQVYQQALALTEGKNVSKDKEKTAKDLAVGAILFAILKNNRIKDFDFQFDRVLNFEGDTAAYIQYTAVRIKSIFKKAEFANSDDKTSDEKILARFTDKIKNDGEILYQVFITNDESSDDIRNLIDSIILEIYKFDDILHNLLKEKEPYILCRYLLKLANLFNQLYSKVRILGVEKESQAKTESDEETIRLVFVRRIYQVLEKGLDLLGISIPDAL